MLHAVASTTTIRKVAPGLGALCLVLIASVLISRAQSAPPQATAAPGAMSDGTMLLPNGWRLAPAGKHLPLSTLPLNIIVSPDGRYALITSYGLMIPALTVVYIASWQCTCTLTIIDAAFGLAFCTIRH